MKKEIYEYIRDILVYCKEKYPNLYCNHNITLTENNELQLNVAINYKWYSFTFDIEDISAQDLVKDIRIIL